MEAMPNAVGKGISWPELGIYTERNSYGPPDIEQGCWQRSSGSRNLLAHPDLRSKSISGSSPNLREL